MFLGLDTSTRSVCIGYLNDNGIWYEWIPLEGKELFPKMLQSYSIITEWLKRERNYPMVVFIEEPVYVNNGKTHKALCCIYGAVVMAFMDWEIVPVPVNIMKWKKGIVGKGSANKDMVREFISQKLNLSTTLEQDIYDALAITLYARKVGG